MSPFIPAPSLNGNGTSESTDNAQHLVPNVASHVESHEDEDARATTTGLDPGDSNGRRGETAFRDVTESPLNRSKDLLPASFLLLPGSLSSSSSVRLARFSIQRFYTKYQCYTYVK